jgi:hypothetical protein
MNKVILLCYILSKFVKYTGCLEGYDRVNMCSDVKG